MIKLEKERRDKTTDLAGIAFSRNRDSRVTEKYRDSIELTWKEMLIT